MKKKLYMVLDTETATLPFANQLAKNEIQKQKIAIAKPLVYDIGWVIIDRKGNIVKKANYLVQETFFVPNVFNTAYYKDKRPLYLEMLDKQEIITKNWNDIIYTLQDDLSVCDMVTAYNATFDFKKAIPFTERYIEHLYNTDYTEWESRQYRKCIDIVQGKDKSKNDKFLTPIFTLRGQDYPMADLWGLACQRLINNSWYKNYCLNNDLYTKSALYFKTSAETTFQYLTRNFDFIEAHTALDDARIEAEILTKILKRGKVEPDVSAFPFRELGTTYDYIRQNKKKKYLKKLIKALLEYYDTLDDATNYANRIMNIILELEVMDNE